MATLKEHGILMSAPMVRAILAGTKTQTRRGVLGATGAFWDHAAWRPVLSPDGSGIVEWATDGGTAPGPQPKAPHGPVGRRLWVRETWAEVDPDYREMVGGKPYVYRADYDPPAKGDYGMWCRRGSDPPIYWNGKWKPAIHMPRDAARITLEVTRVRVERVGDISEEDAKAEGVEPMSCSCCERSNGGCTDGPMGRCCPCCNGTGIETCAVETYEALWDEINGAGSFAASPWVWVYDFRRVG